jgi:peptide deformylase
MRREALTYPHPIFTEVAKPIEEIDDEVLALARDLLELLRANRHVMGVAAHALGEARRIIAVDVSDHPGATANHGPMIILNPEIGARDGEVDGEETCLGLPGRIYRASRAERIFLKGMNIDGTEIAAETSSLEARAILHQMDHLDGRLPWGAISISDLPRL